MQRQTDELGSARGNVLALLSAVLRGRWNGLLRLRPATQPVGFECLREACGLCCSCFGGGVVVNGAEARALPIHSVKVTRGGTVLRAESNGRCALLSANLSCTAYDVRPQGCREYPWYRVSGELYFDSGCPGMRFDRDDRPKVAELRAVEGYLTVAAPLRRAILALFRVW
jgi:Fe-S-cluster containining protein